MKNLLFRSLLTFFVLTYFTPAFAIAPGDACSTTGHTISDNSDNTFSNYICDGSNWVILTQGTASGYLGINKDSPAAPLDISGTLKIGSSGAACNGSNEGTIQFNSSTKSLDLCTGSAWTSINNPCDYTPAALDFADQVSASTSTVYASSITQITDISCATNVEISGAPSPEYRICSDSACSSVVQAYGSTSSTITNGQYLQLRNTSDSTSGVSTTATVHVGTLTDNFIIHTTPAYKRVFITSGRYRGAFGGVEAADEICMGEATEAGLSGTYYAWVSTDATNDPESRFTRSSIPYRFVDGTLMANNWTDLVDGSISSSNVRIQADGNETIFSSSPWTGTNDDGTAYLANADPLLDNCNGWQTDGAAYKGLDGRNNTTYDWSSGSEEECDQQNWLYCFEQ